MNQGQKNQLKEGFTVIFICLLIIFLGFGCIFIAKDDEESIKMYGIGIILIVFAGSLLVFSLIKSFKDKNFWKKRKGEEIFLYLRLFMRTAEAAIIINTGRIVKPGVRPPPPRSSGSVPASSGSGILESLSDRSSNPTVRSRVPDN